MHRYLEGGVILWNPRCETYFFEWGYGLFYGIPTLVMAPLKGCQKNTRCKGFFREPSHDETKIVEESVISG